MQLTLAQLDTLKTWLTSGPGAGLQDEEARAALNALASPAYLVWNPAAEAAKVRGALDVSKYTPTDSPPASTNNVTGTNDALLYQNRALSCQLKQANAMFFAQATGAIDATPQALRQSFNDCMTGIPSGASGAAQNAAWGTAGTPGAVRLALQRRATVGEKLFSGQGAGAGAAGNVSGDARGGTTNPDALGTGSDGGYAQGDITAENINAARNRP